MRLYCLSKGVTNLNLNKHKSIESYKEDDHPFLPNFVSVQTKPDLCLKRYNHLKLLH